MDPEAPRNLDGIGRMSCGFRTPRCRQRLACLLLAAVWDGRYALFPGDDNRSRFRWEVASSDMAVLVSVDHAIMDALRVLSWIHAEEGEGFLILTLDHQCVVYWTVSDVIRAANQQGPENAVMVLVGSAIRGAK